MFVVLATKLSEMESSVLLVWFYMHCLYDASVIIQTKKSKGRPKPAPSYGRQATQAKKKQPPALSKDKTVKELLGNLYADRVFLDDLLKETGMS